MIQLIHELAAGVRNDSDAILSSGTVTVYEAGTTTLQTVYQEYELETPHANPLTLDSAGRAIAYADGRVKLVIANSDGTVIRTIDDVGIEDSDVDEAAAGATAGVGLVGATDGSIDVNVDGSTISVNSNDQLYVPDSGITTAKITDGAVTGAKIEASPTITTSVKINSTGATWAKGDASGTGQVSGDLQVGGASKPYLSDYSTRSLSSKNSSNSAEYPLVNSYPGGTHGDVIVRGTVSSAGAVVRGAGFTAAKNATGNYTITFTTTFAAVPIVVAMGASSTVAFAISNTALTATADILTYDAAGAATDLTFHFIAIGERGA